MSLTLRPYHDDTDYWRVRAFLREVLPLNAWRERCWDVVRWDYWRWHVNANIFHFPLAEAVFLWETADGDLAAVLNLEDPGSAFLQVHPAWRSVELEREMVATAEARFPALANDRRRLTLWVHQDDTLRQSLLTDCGYVKGDWPEHQRRQVIPPVIPAAALPAGYTVRALGDANELPARSWLSWKAFHPDEPDEKYEGWDWYLNVQRGPLYRRDLDMVAVAPDGELAAFCTVWYDDVNRTLTFEPVGTHPNHQRRGLGRAVMTEGLRRGARLGATRAYVGSYSAPAHALYAAMGFTDVELCERWCRSW